MIVELEQEEADILNTLLTMHVGLTNEGIILANVADKLGTAGAKLGSLKWHVNDFGHIHIDSFNL